MDNAIFRHMNEADGIEVVCAPNKMGGYSVTMRDTDADLHVPVVGLYRADQTEQAIAYAKKIAGIV